MSKKNDLLSVTIKEIKIESNKFILSNELIFLLIFFNKFAIKVILIIKNLFSSLMEYILVQMSSFG